ncbi:hypothetical protein ACFSCV_09090 [Methylopila henanensis]|uniref:Uncharacterized protein n=1 Tax=Methylopila henanensis TaxID=873516 RepID=A0ABW4K627_9HYPH
MPVFRVSSVGGLAVAAAVIAAPALAQGASDGARANEAAALVAQGVPAKPAGDASCPRVIALRGAERFPRSGGDSHRATVEGLARDCANLGAETILKVSVVGQGARSSGGPSWFNAPLSVTVIDDRGQPVASSRAKLKVQLPRGKTEGAFTHVVEDLSLPAARDYAGWTAVVGFEVGAAEAQRAAKTFTAAR